MPNDPGLLDRDYDNRRGTGNRGTGDRGTQARTGIAAVAAAAVARLRGGLEQPVPLAPSPPAPPVQGTPGVHLEEPDIVVQKSAMFCWAAAGSSWLDVVYGRTRTQEQLVKSYANAPSGGLDSWNAKTDRPSPSFVRFADGLRFSFQKMPGRQLTADLIAAKLKANGHLLLFFNLSPGGDAHTVVIYGINHPGGKGLLLLDVMDPDGGKRGVRPLEEFQSKNLLILGWPK